ncbi:MAG TPA: inorganic phosphate transporter [Alphaproteobacteria bacterium]|nr:inorganic phosphate transporter [Alphaproteobacteria bacterium]
MNAAYLSIALVVIAAVIFDFINGFHDAANSIATIVATRVLKPLHAVMWASFFNFLALFIFGTGVAATVGSGMIALNMVTPTVILAGLCGAIVWGLITWWLGLPTSSSHALMGGYAGAAMANSAILHGWRAAYDPIIASGWVWVIAFIVIAPVIGLFLAEMSMKIVGFLTRKRRIKKPDLWFGRMQMFSSAFLSLMHGANDAQKTAGVIGGALVTAGVTTHFTIPIWVLILSYTTMGLGTLAGGWRIVNTMGRKLTRLRPASGFCAESAAALSILLATLLKLPISTTHPTTGAIVGVGAARSIRMVRWKVARDIFWAWVLTMPAAAAMGALAMGIALWSGA